MEATEPKKPERTTARWIVDVLMILLSVAVGFVAAQFGEYRSNRELASTVEQRVLAEVEHNLAVIEPMLEKHRAWKAALEKVDTDKDRRSAYDIVFDARPDGGVSIGVPLEQAAWSTAVSSGTLKLLDYDVSSALSDIYSYQTLMTDNHNRFIANSLYSPSTFDPASRKAAVRMLWGVMAEIVGNEEALRGLYVKHLPTLRKTTR